jgi:hypothetical protein
MDTYSINENNSKTHFQEQNQDKNNKNITKMEQTNIFPNQLNGNNVDFRYICIKKDFFDVNMIYLNYMTIKDHNYIEIIYKSPSIFLEGLFFKTPIIKFNQIYVSKKIKKNGFGTNNNATSNSVSIRIILDYNNPEQIQFINMLLMIDTYILNYIGRFTKDINRELNLSKNNMNCVEMYKYEPIIKTYSNYYEINMKSYLDNKTINELQNTDINNILINSKITLTFNISHIYFGNYNLIPLVKCNKCQIET